MSITAAKADQWLPIRPGTEALVAQAIARLIADQGQGPTERIARAKSLAGQVDVNSVASLSDIPVAQLARLARIFAKNGKVLAIPGGSMTGQPEADKAVAAVQMLNMIAGNVGQPGGMALSTNSSVPGIVKSQPSPFTDVQQLISQMRSGSIKVLLIHGANPAYDLPPQVGFKDALAKVPTVVSFSSIPDETAILSDLVLPDRTYLEAWGYNQVSPDFGMPVISSQQPVVTPVFDVRSTGDVMLTMVKGIPAAASVLPYNDEVAYLKDIVAKLPAGANGGTGPDVLWARYLQHGGWWPAGSQAAAAPQASAPQPVQISAPQYQGQANDYPFFLHLYVSDLLSDGRGASQPWLQGSPDPMTTVSWQTLVEINPTTAKKLGLSDGDMVKVTSPNGEIQAPIYTFPAIRPDTVAIATGQGHTDFGRYAQNHGANPIQLVGAQAEASGNNLTFSNLRVKITPTGQKVSLALFEYKLGVTQGFINAAFPGQ
jgi:anaerobic selenocysteine-containing dehydrogenase